MMKLTGFDFNTCAQIQGPVLSLHMAADTMGIAHEVIGRNFQMMSQAIHGRLLDLQLDKFSISNHPKFDISKTHIGFERHRGKDEKGNCIIAEKFSDTLKNDPKALSKIKIITVGDTNMDDKAVSGFADVIQH